MIKSFSWSEMDIFYAACSTVETTTKLKFVDF